MTNTKQSFPIRLIGLFIFALALTACSQVGGTTESTAAPSAIPLATQTSTPWPGTALFYASPESDPQLAAEARQILQSYASGQQLIFEELATLPVENITPQTELILLIGPHEGLAELAAAAPQARIIAIGAGQQVEAANLQLLTLSTKADEQAAFITGYIAALSTEDWRIGLIYTVESAHLAEAFIAGMKFFCGSCKPVAPPYVVYPQIEHIADVQNWQPAADLLFSQFVRTVYLTPELETPAIHEYFFNRDLLLVGSRLSDPRISEGWLASVAADSLSTLRQQLPQALAGLPLDGNASPLTLTEINPSYLSDARLRNVQQVIDDLLAGFIALPSTD
jgi:hypothetical protein